MQNRYLNEIITLDSENDIEHHGVMGMKWGIRRYQPYSLIPRKSGKNGKLVGDAKKKAKSSSKTSVSKKAASKKVADVKKSRNQKSAEAKAAAEKQEKTARQRRESLDKLIKSGDAKSIYERRSEMSQKQLQEAVNRLNTEKQLRSIVAEQNPSKLNARVQKFSDIMDTVNKVNTAVNTGVNTYSSASHIKKDLFNINENNLENNFNYTCLDLEVINSWNLPKGLKIHITKDHLENSLRNMNDGKIYFGFQKDLNLSEERPYIDYLLLPKDNEYDDKFIGVHFQIKYDENNFKYYIKDLGSGYGTFVKLIEPIKIKNNLLINIGDTFIVFTINENEEKNDILILKIFTGNEQSEIFEFKPEKKIILIGRDISSDVYIEDKMLSRKHCYIYYEKNGNNNEEKNNWFIKDGDVNGKKSTNDTWLYLLEDTLIFDQMIIKTNHNLLRCNCR